MATMRLVRAAVHSTVSPEEALLLLDARARAIGLPPPAALSGEWFGSQAVIAPSVAIGEVSDGAAYSLPLGAVEDAAPGAIGGGWFGYLSYDLIDPSKRRTPMPCAAWGWADHVLRLDRDGRWWFEALVDGDDWRELRRELAATLRGVPSRRGWTAAKVNRPLATEHQDAVKACVHAIEAGELFQANICTRFSASFDGNPAELFGEGIRRLRPRRAAFLSGQWGAVVSLSPELFLSRQGDLVRSIPIKGTLPRRNAGDDPLADLLRRSEKDVAENVMITDLVRNDLGRVCEVGSVRVPELLAVRPAPGVWHLESTVEGRVIVGDTDLLAATFPPGSVTGAPKLRALDLIAELEASPRGIYTGAIGLVSPVAGLELNVAIRTFEVNAGTLWLGVGGGITADSDPVREWQECLYKAAPLEQLLANPPARVG